MPTAATATLPECRVCDLCFCNRSPFDMVGFVPVVGPGTPCHFACRQCATRYLASNHKCPWCRYDIKPTTVELQDSMPAPHNAVLDGAAVPRIGVSDPLDRLVQWEVQAKQAREQAETTVRNANLRIAQFMWTRLVDHKCLENLVSARRVLLYTKFLRLVLQRCFLSWRRDFLERDRQFKNIVEDSTDMSLKDVTERMVKQKYAWWFEELSRQCGGVKVCPGHCVPLWAPRKSSHKDDILVVKAFYCGKTSHSRHALPDALLERQKACHVFQLCRPLPPISQDDCDIIEF